MCYFIHLSVQTEPRRRSAVEGLLRRFAEEQNLILLGNWPHFRVTNDGICSCHMVHPAGTIGAPATSLIECFVTADAAQSIQAAWGWGDEMPVDARIKPVSLHRFLALNEKPGLLEQVWYDLKLSA